MIKEAKKFGSGAHVTVPRSWVGDEVQVINLTDKGKNNKEGARQ